MSDVSRPRPRRRTGAAAVALLLPLLLLGSLLGSGSASSPGAGLPSLGSTPANAPGTAHAPTASPVPERPAWVPRAPRLSMDEAPPAPSTPAPPAPIATGAPTTLINGSAHINGSLLSSQNDLVGSVHIVGTTLTQGWTQTVGWADYGPSQTTGTMSIVPAASGWGPIFTTAPGSSLWVDAPGVGQTALNVMQGNVSLGNAGSGAAYAMTTTAGVTLTIEADQAGDIASYPSSATNLNSGSNIVIDNFANSTGSVTLSGCTLVCPITVSPGSTFTPCYPIIGCISASSTSISWGADTFFSISGTTSTSGSGVTASLPDSRLAMTIPYGDNMSLTPAAGSPSLTIAPGPSFPGRVVILGHATVSDGETLSNADTLVQGTFQAAGTESDGGTFYNDGGLAIHGAIDAAGMQLFRHNLTIGPQVRILSFPGENITNTGSITVNSVAVIQGWTATVGTLWINGTLDQGPMTNVITGNVTVQGTIAAQGYVATSGTTSFLGIVQSSGDLGLPGSFLTGSFAMTAGSFVDVGTTALTGATLCTGTTQVTSSTYTVTGSSTLTGSVRSTGAITVTGTSVLRTAPGAWLHLGPTVQMGVTAGGWTAQVHGNVYTQGVSFVNGTTTFSSSLVTFPPGLSVHGTAWTVGNVTVQGATVFAGSVQSSGTSRFPGTLLVGNFSLSSPGTVTATGSSWVNGNVSMVGVLSVGVGSFQEDGASSILGSLQIAGPVQIAGDAVIATGAAGALHLNSTVLLGASGGSFTSEVLGSVFTQGTIYTNGTTSLNATTTAFPPGLSVHGETAAEGNVTVLGSSTFDGPVQNAGTSRFPGALLQGTFELASPGLLTENGTTWVEGNVTLDGLLQVTPGSFAETGSSAIRGYADLTGTVSVQGDASIQTGPGGGFHMSGTIDMGVGAQGTTSVVVGSILTQGTIFSNGSSTFGAGTASFPPGLSVHGTVESQGSTSVYGATDFTGAVTTSGASFFPGMTLEGTFGLSALGGSVNATGTSSVVGNISLTGALYVGSGSFQEVGSSWITGTLTMTGTVVVNGDSTLTTTAGTLLEMSGNIQLARAAHIVGNVNASGGVTIAGSAVLSASSVQINGAMSLDGWVTSRGDITLTGVADFQGPVLTQGHTSLSGLNVSGNFSLHEGEFHLAGTVSLVGETFSEGSVVTNSSGYFVVGSSRIEGTTTAVGSAWVRGASTTVGDVDLAGGSQFGTYMVVNGDLDTGGLDLHGPVVLPNDTVTFSSEANITGSIWENGLLTSSDGTAVFVGTSIINGTVASAGSPSTVGPVVLPLLGSSFALTLGLPFYLMLGALLAVAVVGLLELVRGVVRLRRPLRPHEREAVRPLRGLAAGAGLAMLAGTGVALGGSFWLGSVLLTPSGASGASWVGTVEVASALVLLSGLLLWGIHRVSYRVRRRRAGPEGPDRAPRELEEVGGWEEAGIGAPGEPPAVPPELLEAPAPGPYGAVAPAPSGPPTWVPAGSDPYGPEELPPWAKPRPPPKG